ncbi:class I SAM-dependent methyltransferase [Neorhizobium sp. T786]|uniref:class I SAM-dependent methyltransferase n=1 Tax=Pseudorhizobium xiangyangii TaxID=2883104 RepID=UPI001CFFF11F|nr:class I SAM-dependent methyltransferase [Neorhizobium xiangyangii]MCB5202604.1 class I SAM-dependent methyltransferase [Neorhizobium xiangyangii]
MENPARVKNFRTVGLGLEIAPYFNPALPRHKYNVHYTDYISNDEILAKAAENPGALNKEIPTIDYVWKPGRPLKETSPEGLLYDFAIASHVMEHVPNTVGWLNDILAVLKVGAVLRLVLPNAERSNDHFRARTSVAQLVANWLDNPSVPTPFQVFDFMADCLDDDGNNTFDENGVSIYTRRHYSLADALSTAQFVHNERQYIDVHCTVWTADTFKEAFDQIVSLGLMNVKVEIQETAMWEFTVDLIKLGEPSVFPPQDLRISETTQTDLAHARMAFHECAALLRAKEEQYNALAASRHSRVLGAVRRLLGRL